MPRLLAKRVKRKKRETASSASFPNLPSLLLQAQNVASRLEIGAHRRRRSGMGQDFWQFRIAQPHEPLRLIDWRQSARSRQLWVRQKEAETQRSLAIWCDNGASMQWRSDPSIPLKRDIAWIAALALGGAALKGGENASLLARDRKARTFRTTRALSTLAQELALSDGDAVPHDRDVPPSSDILLVSDFLWSVDRVEDALSALRSVAQHLHLICVLDPGEIWLPFRGFNTFSDVSMSMRHQVSVDDDVAKAYEKALQAHLDALRGYITSRGGSFTLLPTDRDIAASLRSLHARLSARMRGEAR